MPRRGPSNTTFAPQTLTCRLFGCRFRFAAEGTELRWWCARGCPSGGEKVSAREDDARRMAAALDREPRSPARIIALLGGTLHRERGGGGGPEPNPPARGEDPHVPAGDRTAAPG
jgi:hypothetical protein